MGRHQAKKALKYMLHEGLTAGRDAGGHLHTQRIQKKITPTKDCCVNRENPHRKLPTSSALVVGFDAKGNFQGTIPHGFTHGYWTTTLRPYGDAEDHAGSSGSAGYVARTLMEFDLDETGITSSDTLVSAVFSFFVYKSDTIPDGNKYLFDFHRVHPGLTANTIGRTSATAVDAIDTTGYTTSDADASFTISIPTSAGGLGGTAVTILLDEDKDDINQATAAANTITIGTFDASENDDQVADFIINAINGVAAGRFVYASSGNGQAGHNLGITAKQGSSGTKITLTVDNAGTSGNISSALSSTESPGTDIVDEANFTGGARLPDNFNENATWYEYNHSGTGLSGPGHGEGGPTGSRGFLATDGTTHGNNRWEYQGLGWTGATAEHTGDDVGGATQWNDYSGGVSGSNQIEILTDNIYSYGFTADKTNIKAGNKLDVDFLAAVKDAIANYDNKLRFMIKLRNDHEYDYSTTIAFMAIQGSEQGLADSVDHTQKGAPEYSPSLRVEYLR